MRPSSACSRRTAFTWSRWGKGTSVTGIQHLSRSGLYVNGGYFIFRKEIFNYIRDGEELVEEPFHRLVEEGLLAGYRHDGFWLPMDTFKDKQLLEDMYSRGVAPWEVWKNGRRHSTPSPHRGAWLLTWDARVYQEPVSVTSVAWSTTRRRVTPSTVMLNSRCGRSGGAPLRVLCLGSHSDDLEIGCGGTLLKLIEAHAERERPLDCLQRARRSGPIEARTSAMQVPGRGGREQMSRSRAFRDGFFPYVGYDIKQFFEELKQTMLSRSDLHPLSRRSASGPPADLGPDVEYVS